MVDLDQEMDAIARGDSSAFARWLRHAEAPLRAGLRSFAARVDLEAVLQETLLRTWQLAPRLRADGRPNTLLRFALRSAHNLAIDEARRAGFRDSKGEEELTRLLDSLASSLGPPSSPDPLLRRAILACKEKLPKMPGMAMKARLLSFGAEPDEAIAKRLGMRTNTFLQNITRARRALYDCLRKKGVPLSEIAP